MVHPLRKRRSNGDLYQRRPAVETELQELEKLSLLDVLGHARRSEQHGKPSVSSEALVHILRREVRTATTRSSTLAPIDGLLQILIQRSETMVRRHLRGFDEEIDREEICKEVTDRIVDEICEDTNLADYAEVNFNDWLRHNRLDACRKQRRKIERIGDSVEVLAEDEVQIVPESIEDAASPGPTPEAAYALSEASEKSSLPPRIEDAELSPEDRRRIAWMVKRANLPPEVLDAFLIYHYLDIQIESEDPEKHTLVKQLGKSEKTIRSWIKRAEKVFAKLRETKDESEPDEASKPGISPARVSS